MISRYTILKSAKLEISIQNNRIACGKYPSAFQFAVGPQRAPCQHTVSPNSETTLPCFERDTLELLELDRREAPAALS